MCGMYGVFAELDQLAKELGLPTHLARPIIGSCGTSRRLHLS